MQHRRIVNLNIGLVIFALILAYVIYTIVRFANAEDIRPYEVRMGSLSTQSVYRGMIIRDEHVVPATASGYVDFLAKEGERVAVGSAVYAVDETGRHTEDTDGVSGIEITLDDSDYTELRDTAAQYSRAFAPTAFSSVYEFKDGFLASVRRLSSAVLMETLAASGTKNSVRMAYSPTSGVVMYWTDGYEELKADRVTEELLDEEAYKRHIISSGELLAEGDTAYKVCRNEDWSVVIETDPKLAAQLIDEEYVKIRFVRDREEAWARCLLVSGEPAQAQDGDSGDIIDRVKTLTGNADTAAPCIVELVFSNSMVRYVDSRFIDVELLLHDDEGLKIPVSSIAERSFYLIPEEYVTKHEDTGKYTVKRETLLEDGTVGSETVDISVYSLVDGEYYVDTSILGAATRLLTESGEDFLVSKRDTLVGVYNMNKGFADFRRIEILYESDEYAIVRSNTEYGLNVYDLIVQDASAVEPDQFLYE